MLRVVNCQTTQWYSGTPRICASDYKPHCPRFHDLTLHRLPISATTDSPPNMTAFIQWFFIVQPCLTIVNQSIVRIRNLVPSLTSLKGSDDLNTHVTWVGRGPKGFPHKIGDSKGGVAKDVSLGGDDERCEICLQGSAALHSHRLHGKLCGAKSGGVERISGAAPWGPRLPLEGLLERLSAWLWLLWFALLDVVIIEFWFKSL